MNKSISVERIYSLGDYQNIKFTDTILEIPQAILENADAMKNIRYLQLVDVEWAYLRYMKLRSLLPQGRLDEALEYVETERARTFEDLLKEIRK